MTNPFPTVTPIEFIWTLFAFVGIVLASVLFGEVLADRRALKSAGRNGAYKIISNLFLSSALTRLTIMLGALILGVDAMLIPPSTVAQPTPTFHYIIAVSSVFLIEIAALLSVVFNFHFRRALFAETQKRAAENLPDEAKL